MVNVQNAFLSCAVRLLLPLSWSNLFQTLFMELLQANGFWLLGSSNAVISQSWGWVYNFLFRSRLLSSTPFLYSALRAVLLEGMAASSLSRLSIPPWSCILYIQYGSNNSGAKFLRKLENRQSYRESIRALSKFKLPTVL